MTFTNRKVVFFIFVGNWEKNVKSYIYFLTVVQPIICAQWRRLHGERGGARVPHFYKWLGTGGTVSRRTANKKLTKLYTDHHESVHQNN